MIGFSSHPSQLKRLPLRQAALWSVVGHLASPVVLGLILAILGILLYLLLHWNLWDWLKHMLSPSKPQHELSFVLMQPTDAPKPKDSRLLGSANQLASGAPDPKLSEQVQQSTPTQPVQPKVAPELKPALQPKAVEAPVAPKQPAQSTQKLSPVETAPTMAQPEKTGPKPVFEQKPATENKSSIPPLVMAATHPVNPSPTEATPLAGNPAQSTDTKTPPQAAVSQSELVKSLAPFMDDLKKRLSKNWNPPRGEENHSVVVRLEVGREGNLLKVAIDKTSGTPEIDQAALDAVEHAAPFTALPDAFSQPSVPVLFTFDYTIVGLK